MLVCESMDAYISFCMVAKSSIRRSESSDPFHHALSLVSPITDVPLQRSIPVRVPGRGGGSGSAARLGVTVRGVITTALMLT
jgi:hypothetical protein